MKEELQQAREDYQRSSLLEENVSSNAIEQFKIWLKDYQEISKSDFNAMTLSTVNENGKPTSRVVLLKGISNNCFEFYTNYDSDKGRDMEHNPAVALSFFWPELERQIRIEGTVSKMSEAESEAYFQSRPYGSKIGALASPQSKPTTRKALEDNMEALQAQYPENVPKPQHWGGYRVQPERIEFWQGRTSRLHDRLVYRASSDGWSITRLAP